MITRDHETRYSPTACIVGILHPLKGEQRRFFPRGYYVPVAEEERYWESVTEVDGVLFPHEVRPHPQQGGERSLLVVPYENQACYALGPLTMGQTVSCWGKKEVSPDFFVPVDQLTPFPLENTETKTALHPHLLEHPLLVLNTAIDMTYDDPTAYSNELCS